MSGDPHFDFVSCLMHFDGPNNGLRIYDERYNAVTVTGNAKLSTLQSKFGGSSLTLDGSGDRISATVAALGTQDFTLEVFVYPRATANATPVVMSFGGAISAGNAGLFADHSTHPNKYSFWVGSHSTTTALLVGTSDIAYDQWDHVAVTRNNTTWTLWVDGVAEATATSSASITSTTLAVGGWTSTAFDFFGYIDEFRKTRGVARYTANFTPPSAPFPNYGLSGPRTDPNYDKVVLHCHFDGEPGSTTFVDQKGHSLNRTTGSLSAARPRFGGSGGLQSSFTSTHVDYVLGNGDFTIEWWSGFTANVAWDSELFNFQNADGVWGALSLTTRYGGNMRLLVGGTVILSGMPNAASSLGMFHFAVVREGSSIAVFQNGTRRGLYAIGGGEITTNGVIRVAAPAGSVDYMDEFRFTKGVARYPVTSTTYTIPTEPFPDYAPQKLTGTVLDDEGSPLARTVRSFRSSDGLLIDTQESDATTGAFELRATDTTPHFVVVQDPEKNALIFDHITPVI